MAAGAISRLDANKQLSQTIWGVTLVKVEKKTSQHAQLIFEGVNAAGYFMVLAHLTGAISSASQNHGQQSFCFWSILADIKMSKIDPDKLKYGAKGETFVMAKDKIEGLMKEIELERDHPGKHPVAFNILGDRSALVPPLPILKTDNDELNTLLKKEPIKFYELYNCYLARKLTPWQFRVQKHHIPHKHLGAFLGRVIADRLNPFTVKTDHDKALKMATENQKLIDLMEKHVKVEYATAHSCITWSISKLRTLGIELLDAKTKARKNVLTTTAWFTIACGNRKK